MTLGSQFRTSVRSIRAVGVSPKALSGGSGGAGAPTGLLDVRFGKRVPRGEKALSIKSTKNKKH